MRQEDTRAASTATGVEGKTATMRHFLLWALATVLSLVTLAQVLLVVLDLRDGSSAGRVILRVAVAAFCGWLTLLARRAARPTPRTPPTS
jgi:hypothetical protein